MRDRRIASKRIHVERIIGHAKTFKILKKTLNSEQMSMGGRIIIMKPLAQGASIFQKLLARKKLAPNIIDQRTKVHHILTH